MPNRLRRMIVSVVIGLLVGCGGQGPSPRLAEAKHQLQRGDAQRAFDALDGLSGSADIHYLRGVALMQLDKLAAASEEFAAALEKSDEPKIRACRLKLRLFARDLSAADLLIALELEHPGDPVVRLACVYAYEAHAVRLAAAARHEAAAAHRRRAATALDQALARAAEIPEFHPELLDFAVEYGQADSALTLVRLMRQQDPSDIELERREVRLLMATGDRVESIRRANRLYLRNADDPAAAELYAATIATPPASRPHASTFRKLRRRFPDQIVLIAHHAHYLAANHKLTSACQLLASALDSKSMARRADQDRWPLIQAAITLPLQAGASGLAEQQLNRYRGQISDELLVTYYEGQLLHLQQDYDGAQQKMTEVLRGRLQSGGRRDPLVTGAVRWLQRIRRAQGRRTPAPS